ncbi:5'-methylthioadenosine/S-adenosylhomocysteine nucleosidase, partial [Streptococcus suis]
AGAGAAGTAMGQGGLANPRAYHDVEVTAFGYANGHLAGQDWYYPAHQVLLENLKTVLAYNKIKSNVGQNFTS